MAPDFAPLSKKAHSVFNSRRSTQRNEWRQNFDSLQPPIEIYGILPAADAEAQIVGSKFGRRHQSALDVGKISDHFSRRARELYVQISRPLLIRLLAHRRDHHIGSGRSRLLGMHGSVDDLLRSSARPSLSCALVAWTLGLVQRLRHICRAFALRGIVMNTNPCINCEALCALARILARQAVRDHFNRASPSPQSEVDTNTSRSLLATSLNA